MANVQAIELYAGDDLTTTLAARDTANAALSLTGKTVAWYVGRSPWHPDWSNALISKTGTTVSASGGTFSVPLVPADTQYLSGDYEHVAIVTTTSSGLQTVGVRGRFRVMPSLEA